VVNIPSQLAVPSGSVIDLNPPILNFTWNSIELPKHEVFYDGRMLIVEYLAQNSMCSPQKTYRWGFL
jgi:hypothetical protein